MSWQQIVGHDANKAKFAQMISSGRVPNTFLFCGPDGVGKRTLALQFAKSLLCSRRRDHDSCGVCTSCVQVAAGSHPDLITIQRPKDKSVIPVELFIGPEERRMQEGLCHDLSLKPYYGGRKIAIVDDADFINKEGANCLLKTLEEPPAGSVLILIGSSPQRQLPTIRSRCFVVAFDRLLPDQLAKILQSQKLIESENHLLSLAKVSGGSVTRALLMNDPNMLTMRGEWLQQLASLEPAQRGFAKTLADFVDAAGSDSAAKRDRLRLLAEMAIEFFQCVLWKCSGVPSAIGDVELESLAESVVAQIGGDLAVANRCLSRCLEVPGEISANVNAQLLIECWLADLERLARGEFVDLMYC